MNSNQTLHQAQLAKWTSLFFTISAKAAHRQRLMFPNNVSPYAFFYWKHVAKEDYVQSFVSNNPSSTPMCGSDSQEFYNLLDRPPLQFPPLTLSLPEIRIEFEDSVSDEQILHV